MKIFLTILSALLGVLMIPTQEAEACGGFFCGNQPVDQQAEKILFAIDEETNTTDMIVQISYQGDAPDFAWILPVTGIPKNPDVFPQFALDALNTNTSININPDFDCRFGIATGGISDSGAVPTSEGGVTVHLREVVGPYDVAVLGAEDADKLMTWLRGNNFRVSDAMQPIIREYISGGKNFLALKLNNEAAISDISPFRMTLEGTTPSIPIRLTALASEPEMGIVALIFANQRYQAANWANLEIPDSAIRFDRSGNSNWVDAVARAVDSVAGRGWVTEYAENTESLKRRLQNTFTQDEEQMEAVEKLRTLIEPHAYISRLYTRLSAEEMTLDPVFRRSNEGDVSRFRAVPVEGLEDMCWFDRDTPVDNCDFTTCGSQGLCRELPQANGSIATGCACRAGTTARVTTDPNGQATVICQDQRISYVNAEDTGTNPCLGFSCGEFGTCVGVNMTPTCVCDQGYVAMKTGSTSRAMTCVRPSKPIQENFYKDKLPEVMNPGRTVVVMPPPTEATVSGSSDGCRAGASGNAAFFLFAAGALFMTRRRRR